MVLRCVSGIREGRPTEERRQDEALLTGCKYFVCLNAAYGRSTYDTEYVSAADSIFVRLLEPMARCKMCKKGW